MSDKKVVSIILEECNKIEESCEGYREAIVELITDILYYERQHRISPTYIQKQINDRCNATAKHIVQQNSKI